MAFGLHYKAGNSLGEGSLWDHRIGALLWVDMPNHRVFRLPDGSREPEVVHLPEEPGCIAMLSDGRYLTAAGRSLYRVSFEDHHRYEKVREVQSMDPSSVLNDGKADRNGRFIFGSKHDEETEAKGAMFTFDGGSLRVLQMPFTVFNGPAFNRAGDRIYFADSPSGRIFCAAYRSATGEMGVPEVFARVAEDAGYPDGMTVDAEDCLWSAHWDGYRLTRYCPDGRVDSVVELPVCRPTSICFGGADLKTIFVTSAAGENQDSPSGRDEIDDGDLLSLRSSVSGLPAGVVSLANCESTASN